MASGINAMITLTTMHNKTFRIIAVASLLALAPISAFAVPANYPFVSEWSLPAPSGTYPYGTNIVFTGTWQLPPNWAGNIYFFEDGVELRNLGGDNYVPISNIGGAVEANGSFTFDIGTRPEGGHTLQIKFWGGEQCALNTILNSLDGGVRAPECVVSEDNFVPNQVYPARTYSVGVPPYPRLVVTPMGDPALAFNNIPSGSPSPTQSFIIENTGGETLSGNLSGVSDPFFCVLGCPYVLTPMERKEVRIQVFPASVGSFENTAVFSCMGTTLNCESPSIVRRITATAVGVASPPQVAASPSPLAFGTVNYGTGAYSDRILTVSNVGGGLLNGTISLSSSDYQCVPSCNYSIFSGGSTPIRIRYLPGGPGSSNEFATLTGGTGVSVPLSGFANDLPILSVSPASWIIGGRVNVGSSRVGVFYVRNVGAGTLRGSVLGLPLNGFSCVSGCNYTSGLTPFSAPWPVTLRFEPTGPTVFSATAEFTNDLGPSVFVPLQGEGNTSAVAAVNITTLPFGPVIVGSTLERSVVLTNTGAANLVGAVSLTSANFACVSAECAGYDIPPGGAVTLTFRFSPTAVQNYNAVATVSGITIALSGSGVQPTYSAQYYDSAFGWRNITPIPGQIDFGATVFGGSPTAQNRSMWFLVRHSNGGGPMTYSFVNTPHFQCISANCSGSINNTYTLFQVQFRPDAATEFIEDTTIQYSFIDGVPREQTFRLRGESVSAPYLSVTPSYWIWGAPVRVGDTVRTTITIQNLGVGDLIGDITFAAGSVFSCTVCTYNIPTGGSQDIEFTFTPTSSGFHFEYPVFTSNGGNITSFFLQGQGTISAIMELDPFDTLDLGDSDLGSGVLRSIRVTNTGIGDLVGNASVWNGRHFQCVTNCAYSVPPGGSLNVVVRFAPLTTGPLTDTITFNSNAANGNPRTVNLVGNGIFAPIIDIRGGDTNFGRVVRGTSRERSFIVRNLGTADLGTGSFTFTGSPFFTCVDPVDPFDGLCHYNLPAGGETRIRIRFSPLALGPASSIVSLSGVPLATFFVNGIGVPPEIIFKER